MQPSVSILIPAYNAEPWIGDTIRSALAQTWPRKGIIVVDDDSRDRTLSPYTHVFQSGVLFLGYSFGLPVIAADMGTLKKEVIEGETGFIFKPQDSSDLASKIDSYFKGKLFHNLETRRAQIKKYANERYSWDKVAKITTAVYSDLLAKR